MIMDVLLKTAIVGEETFSIPMILELAMIVVFAVASVIAFLFHSPLARHSYESSLNKASAKRANDYASLAAFPRRVPCCKETEIRCLSLEKVFLEEKLAERFVDAFVRRFSSESNAAPLLKCDWHYDSRELVRVVLAVEQIEPKDLTSAIAVVVADWGASITISVRWSRWSLSRIDKSETTRFRELKLTQTEDVGKKGKAAQPEDEVGKKAERLALIASKIVLEVVDELRDDPGAVLKRELFLGL